MFTKLNIFRPTCPHLGIFWMIQAHSESWHSYLDVLMYIKAYSETLAYLASFRHYTRAIHTCSEPY